MVRIAGYLLSALNLSSDGMEAVPDIHYQATVYPALLEVPGGEKFDCDPPHTAPAHDEAGSCLQDSSNSNQAEEQVGDDVFKRVILRRDGERPIVAMASLVFHMSVLVDCPISQTSGKWCQDLAYYMTRNGSVIAHAMCRLMGDQPSREGHSAGIVARRSEVMRLLEQATRVAQTANTSISQRSLPSHMSTAMQAGH